MAAQGRGTYLCTPVCKFNDGTKEYIINRTTEVEVRSTTDPGVRGREPKRTDGHDRLEPRRNPGRGAELAR
jgi:hypothetical protein